MREPKTLETIDPEQLVQVTGGYFKRNGSGMAPPGWHDALAAGEAEAQRPSDSQYLH